MNDREPKKRAAVPNPAPEPSANPSAGPAVNRAFDELVPLEKLVPNPRNPNQHPQSQVALLARITGGTCAAFDPDKPCPTVLGTKPNQFAVEGLDMTRFAIGKEQDRLRPGQSSDRYFNLV